MAVFIKKVNIPQKSDLINIDMTGSGTAQTYRVIKNVGGSVVEVIAMADATSMAFDSGNANTYEGKTLDTYLNTTWYNTLSNTAKTAIIDKTFRQDSWYFNSTQGNPKYQGTYNGGVYTVSLANASFGNEITRHAYAISVQDVIDYLEVTPEMTTSDTTLTSENVWTLFWNSTTTHNGNIWLRSVSESGSPLAFNVNGVSGSLYYISVSSSNAVRPAFQIDLSKIDYTFTDGRQPVELKPVSILQKSNNALSRVGMSYKTELPRVTDLTGTTWKMNTDITTTIPTPTGRMEAARYINASMLYEANNTNNTFAFHKIGFIDSYSPKKFVYFNEDRDYPLIQYYTDYGWQYRPNESTRTNISNIVVSIIDGTNVSDTTLINWFYANATRIS